MMNERAAYADAPRHLASRSDAPDLLTNVVRAPRRLSMAGIFLTLSLLLGGCAQAVGKRNQRSPSFSPSGRYILTVPVERAPRRRELPYRRVTISDPSGEVLFKDDSKFAALLKVYWLWDGEDRAWLYNSDTGRVYFWELSGGGWKRSEWGYGKVKEVERDVLPPAGLYPDYIK